VPIGEVEPTAAMGRPPMGEMGTGVLTWVSAFLMALLKGESTGEGVAEPPANRGREGH